MSPFRSKAQQRAAFGGHLGPEMKSKAHQWAEETPNIKKLPELAKEHAERLAELKRKARKK